MSLASRRRILPLLLLLSVLRLAGAGVALGQQRDEPFGYRRWLYALAGAALGAVPALVAEENPEGRSPCSSRECITAVAAGVGATVGFLIGRERDQAVARRFAAGPSLRFRTSTIELELLPEELAPFEGGTVVIGREGVAAVDEAGQIRLRGGQIRGIAAAAVLPAHDVLLAATPTGLFAFALRDEESEGQLLLRDRAAAIEPVSASEIVLGSSDLLRRLRLSGQGTGLQAAAEIQAESPGVLIDLAFSPFAGVIWTLSRERLGARSAAQLQELGSVALPATGRSVSISGGRALIAAGADGLFLVDISRPEAPQLVGQVKGIQFAFDAVLEGDVAYVAAGRLGLLVVDVTDPTNPHTLGVVRNLGLVSDVAPAAAGKLYVLDREGRRLHLVEATARAAAPGAQP